jgi:hypothetical protein
VEGKKVEMKIYSLSMDSFSVEIIAFSSWALVFVAARSDGTDSNGKRKQNCRGEGRGESFLRFDIQSGGESKKTFSLEKSFPSS